MPTAIADQHLTQLLQRGYTIVPGFMDPDSLSAARANLLRYFPTDEELRAAPERYGSIYEDPEHLQHEFPFAGETLNNVSTDPAITEFVERALGTPDILLSQAAIWAKYAGTGDFEQGLHLDYQGNTLVVPRDDGDYRQVNFILYYSDVPLDMGPTHVVNIENTIDIPLWPTHRPRRKNAALYQLERPVLANAGDLLIFGMRTWHRASAILADFGVRFSHHLVYRSAHHGFQGYHHWPQHGENEQLQQFIATTSPRRRELLGFPRPGDPYWNPETLAAVQLRYPSMDMSPYHPGR